MSETVRDIVRVAREGRPPLIVLGSAAAFLALGAALGAVPPFLTGEIVDALVHRSPSLVFARLALFAAVAIVTAVVSALGSYATAHAREAFVIKLRRRLMRVAHHAPLEQLADYSFGQLTNRVGDDVDMLCAKIEFALLPTLQAILALGACLVSMLVLDPRLAAVAVASAALSIVPPRFFAPVFARFQREISSNHDERILTITESLSSNALPFFRHPLARAWLLRRYDGEIERARTLRLRSAVWEGISSIAALAATLAGPVAVLVAGAILIFHGSVTPGLVVSFLMYQARLASPIGTLTNLPVMLASVGVFAKRVLEVLDLPGEAQGTRLPERLDVAFHGVSVNVDRRELIAPLDLELPLGTHIAIAGASGSGKSTLAALLLAYRSPSTGCVTIGGIGREDLALAGLRERTVIVAQDPLILDGTIEENLLLLSGERRDGLEEAIRIARLDDVLVHDDGLRRRVGGRGSRLSGGERQRLCLARALHARPEILILDEALTGVDVATEAAILTDVRAFMRGRTLIVISHRPESLSAFDRVARLNDARLEIAG